MKNLFGGALKGAALLLWPVSVSVTPQPAMVYASDLSTVAVTTQSPDCMKQSFRTMSVNTNRSDDVTRVKWETRSCKGTMQIIGNARIAGDLSGFASIDPGGKVEIETSGDGRRRELTLTPSANGFAHAYQVDGDRRAWDDEGKAWLSSVLTLLVRRGGFAVNERVEHLLRSKGVNGVLEEVALLDSDYTQRLYLNRLMSQAALNGGALRSVINLAQRELESDYELTELLIAVAGKQNFTDESRAAFIQATNALQSDYEHRRALSAVLKKGGLNTDDVTAVLVSARSIKSDYEKAEVLIGAAGRYVLDQRSRVAYLAATQGMQSDYEQRRVFTTLLKQDGLGPSDLAQILNATTSMESSYERSQILQMASAQIDLTHPELQQAYVSAAAEIESDYELRQTLTALIKRGRLAPAALDVVLTAAGRIDSDYERTEVLVQMVRNHALTQAQRSRVAKMAEAMNSDHERSRIASALMRQTSN